MIRVRPLKVAFRRVTEMAKQPTTDSLSSLKATIEEIKSNIDKAGVAEWKALRLIRREVHNLIRQIEGSKDA
jgi:hypothetical protein